MMFLLAWKNLLHKPLTTILSWILLSVSVGIISLLLIVQKKFEAQFNNNISNIDLVIGAKGSPLQLILSAVYHIDDPTGNIDYAEAEKWMRHPFVKKAIPLAYGDSYRGYPIVGTTRDYLEQYQADIDKGKLYEKDFEVIVGYALAKKLQLHTGSRFFSTHGGNEQGEEHRDNYYTVTGVLKPAGNVMDNLILCNIESVWKMHAHHEEAAGETHEPEHDEKELTAVLLQFRNPMGLVQLPRLINEQTNMMAATPAIEINRLFTLFGSGIELLRKIGWCIMLLSAFSVFVSMYSSLKERKYEMALMRSAGASRATLVKLLLFEALLLSITGFMTGLLLSRLGLWIMTAGIEKDYHIDVIQWQPQLPGEAWLLVLALSLAILASLLPVMKAWSLNISKTLANE